MYCNTESLLKKLQTCKNNPEKSFTAKISKHAACSHILFT